MRADLEEWHAPPGSLKSIQQALKFTAVKMLIARVIGNVVATQKNQRYEGSRIMLCRQITPEGEDMEYTCLALDSVNAGEGDIVVIAQEGWSASTAATGRPGAAIDSAIVGVVDYVDLL